MEKNVYLLAICMTDSGFSFICLSDAKLKSKNTAMCITDIKLKLSIFAEKKNFTCDRRKEKTIDDWKER